MRGGCYALPPPAVCSPSLAPPGQIHALACPHSLQESQGTLPDVPGHKRKLLGAGVGYRGALCS